MRIATVKTDGIDNYKFPNGVIKRLKEADLIA
jgi:hypothetical protein